MRGSSTAGAVLAAVAGALACATAGGAQAITVADILSAPFHEGMVAASGADVVAWVVNDRGSRNVWVARGPDFEGAPATAYEGDDGQEVGGLQLTPDGRHVLFVRGGASNREGWTPTPAQDPEGAERGLWWAPTDGSAPPTALGEAGSPAVSPDGGRLAFTRDDRIWVRDLPEGEPRMLARPRSGAGSLVWAPTGDRLAFVSGRGDHAFVGILEVASGEYRYLEPSVDLDGSPAWSPDGARVAFIRRPAPEESLPFFPRREGLPWSIRVVDLASDEGREVFRADPGHGSLFQGVDGPQLSWVAGDRLVFPWEKDGWLRLWSVSARGGDPLLLTPGEHEVQRVSVDPDGARILFDSNRDDVDRRHLWSVSPDGGAPELLTPGAGLEWGPVATGGGTVAFIGSGAREPTRPFVLDGAGGRTPLAGPLPSSFPASALVIPEPVVFSSTDGTPIHAQLFLPADLEPGERRPAAIFLHGGSRRQMLLGFHHRGYYHNAYALNQVLASMGFVVLTVNYRSGIGYGLEFREAEDYGADGASEVRDVLAAGLHLQGRADVDPARIGLWGGSYGGYLTAQGLVHAPELFAGGVDIHGVHDWNVAIGNFVPSYVPEHDPERKARAFRSSPLSMVDRWEDPVLLIHGDDDRNVRFSETVDLVRALRGQDVPVETLVFPDEVHGFLLHRNWIAAYEATVSFFRRHLGSGGS
ncbi:MAG TPA: prolyl oligopeptidase family serine peptidase [Longimicrobiales bacterium]|nr:prolyl oligopeptidase family serine peptidase [Longimicrobiales bacterium]